MIHDIIICTSFKIQHQQNISMPLPCSVLSWVCHSYTIKPWLQVERVWSALMDAPPSTVDRDVGFVWARRMLMGNGMTQDAAHELLLTKVLRVVLMCTLTTTLTTTLIQYLFGMTLLILNDVWASIYLHHLCIIMSPLPPHNLRIVSRYLLCIVSPL